MHSTFDQHATARSLCDASKHSTWSRDDQRARRRSNQHSHRTQKCVSESHAEKSHQHKDDCWHARQNNWRIDARKFLRHPLSLAFIRLTLLDQFDHSRHRRLRCQLGCRHEDQAIAVHGSGIDGRPHHLSYGHAFASDWTLIDSAFALTDITIDSDSLAGHHAHLIPDQKRFDGNFLLDATTHNARNLWR